MSRVTRAARCAALPRRRSTKRSPQWCHKRLCQVRLSALVSSRRLPQPVAAAAPGPESRSADALLRELEEEERASQQGGVVAEEPRANRGVHCLCGRPHFSLILKRCSCCSPRKGVSVTSDHLCGVPILYCGASLLYALCDQTHGAAWLQGHETRQDDASPRASTTVALWSRVHSVRVRRTFEISTSCASTRVRVRCPRTMQPHHQMLSTARDWDPSFTHYCETCGCGCVAAAPEHVHHVMASADRMAVVSREALDGQGNECAGAKAASAAGANRKAWLQDGGC